MAAHRPLVYLQGFLTEMPSGDIIPSFQEIAGVTMENLGEGGVAIDTDTNQLCFRLSGDIILRFNSVGTQSNPRGLIFNDKRNSQHIPVVSMT